MTDKLTKKKQYKTPTMEVIEMSFTSTLLSASSEGNNWWDDKPESVCGHGHNPHCSFLD